MRAQSKLKRAAATVIYHVFVISLCFVMLYPILWLIKSSFKPSDEVFRNASSLWPEHFTFRNYAEGWKGFGIYFFLCQRAYKTNGYFYEWGYDDCATTARKMGGGINSGTVKETVDYCLQVDLFDKGLFDRWGVLTSRGIQRRFWTVLSERRSKIVYEEYWLLKPEECKGLVKVSLNSDVQPTNDDVQATN